MSRKKFWSMYTQVNLLKAINHMAVLLGLIYLEIGYWWVAAIASYFVFTRIGSDVGFHRYFTHKSFRASPFFEKILLVLGTLDCKGSMFSWVISHIAHHQHTDKEGDPHSPHRIGFFRVWFIAWEDFPFSRAGIRQYLKDPVCRFTHDHYFAIVCAFMVVVGVINLKMLVFGYCLPMVYSIHMTGVINSICHSRGYRNYRINDESRNNLLVNLLSLGGGLHNNHHAFPGNYRQSTNLHWHEVDPAAAVVDLIRAKEA